PRPLSSTLETLEPGFYAPTSRWFRSPESRAPRAAGDDRAGDLDGLTDDAPRPRQQPPGRQRDRPAAVTRRRIDPRTRDRDARQRRRRDRTAAADLGGDARRRDLPSPRPPGSVRHEVEQSARMDPPRRSDQTPAGEHSHLRGEDRRDDLPRDLHRGRADDSGNSRRAQPLALPRGRLPHR